MWTHLELRHVVQDRGDVLPVVLGRQRVVLPQKPAEEAPDVEALEDAFFLGFLLLWQCLLFLLLFLPLLLLVLSLGLGLLLLLLLPLLLLLRLVRLVIVLHLNLRGCVWAKRMCERTHGKATTEGRRPKGHIHVYMYQCTHKRRAHINHIHKYTQKSTCIIRFAPCAVADTLARSISARSRKPQSSEVTVC